MQSCVSKPDKHDSDKYEASTAITGLRDAIAKKIATEVLVPALTNLRL